MRERERGGGGDHGGGGGGALEKRQKEIERKRAQISVETSSSDCCRVPPLLVSVLPSFFSAQTCRSSR